MDRFVVVVDDDAVECVVSVVGGGVGAPFLLNRPYLQVVIQLPSYCCKQLTDILPDDRRLAWNNPNKHETSLRKEKRPVETK